MQPPSDQPPSDRPEPTSGTGGSGEPTQPPWSTPPVPGMPPSMPPEPAPPYQPPPEPPTYQQPQYEQPQYQQPQYEQPQYEQPQYEQPQYQQPQYEQPQYQQNPPYPPAGGYGAPYQAYPEVKRTNGLAIAALICSLAGFVILISAPVGAILGHMASRQIKQTGENGAGLATAAIIIGWIITGLFLVACCIGVIAIFASANNSYN